MDLMQITIDHTNADQRLDRFMRKWCKNYPDVSLSLIYQWLRKGNIKVNGKKKNENYRLVLGDVIDFVKVELGGFKKPQIPLKERIKKKTSKEEFRHRILYEDTNWLAWNKPAGIVMHPSNQHWKDMSMNDYLEVYLKDAAITTKDDSNETFQPAFGYRLDKDTSGVLIAAKNYKALQYLNKIIRDRQTQKRYKTIVVGRAPKHMYIDKALEKTYDAAFDRAHVVVSDEGKESVTECWCEEVMDHPILGLISVLKVQIHTGRMHQIRVHLADAGYPILGDLVYGKPVVNRRLYKDMKISRQLLHAERYYFYDILDEKEIDIKAPLPADFMKILSF